LEVARRGVGGPPPTFAATLDAAALRDRQALVRRVPVPDHVARYALALVRQTRVGEPEAPAWINDALSFGAGPRAVQHLLHAAKARALLHGRPNASCDDVAALAPAALRHRIVPNFAAESQGLDADKLVARLLAETPARPDALQRDPRFAALLGA
jgi:MoxR-like ATPase